MSDLSPITLDPLGQQGGWTTGSGHHLDRRDLSTPELDLSPFGPVPALDPYGASLYQAGGPKDAHGIPIALRLDQHGL
jgi:hypothetical protein